MAIDLYIHVVSPPCHACQMVAKHLNIELNIKNVDLINGENFSDEYLKLNPAHTVPLLVDDTFALWESRAILQYLCNKYAPDSNLYPKCPKKRAKIDCLLNFDIGSFYQSIKETFFPVFFYGKDFSDESLASLKNALKVLDTIIGDNNYVTGDELTIADLSLLASSTVFAIANFDLSGYKNVENWIKRLQNELDYYEEINGDRQAVEDYTKQIREKFTKK